MARAQRGPQRVAGLAGVGGVDGAKGAVSGQQLAEPERAPPARMEAARSPRRAVTRTPGAWRWRLAPQTPLSTSRSRTRSMSSRTFSATPSVSSSSASSSASSAWAQAMVSPTPGSL